MNKVLIMSDSHGLRDEVEMIKKRHHLTHMFHLGDSELDRDDSVLSHMIKVKGNCDFGQSFNYDEVVEINGLTFFLTHGHLYDVRTSLLSLSYRAAEENAQVICFGHTHIAGAEKINDQLFINPGSIHFPRNRREKTYAILSWQNLDELTVEFYTLSGEYVQDLTYKTKTNLS